MLTNIPGFNPKYLVTLLSYFSGQAPAPAYRCQAL